MLDYLSKICMILFCPSDQRCQKCVYIWKVTSGGRAEIQNGQICKVLHILSFSSATRGHFRLDPNGAALYTEQNASRWLLVLLGPIVCHLSCYDLDYVGHVRGKVLTAILAIPQMNWYGLYWIVQSMWMKRAIKNKNIPILSGTFASKSYGPSQYRTPPTPPVPSVSSSRVTITLIMMWPNLVAGKSFPPHCTCVRNWHRTVAVSH